MRVRPIPSILKGNPNRIELRGRKYGALPASRTDNASGTSPVPGSGTESTP